MLTVVCCAVWTAWDWEPRGQKPADHDIGPVAGIGGEVSFLRLEAQFCTHQGR